MRIEFIDNDGGPPLVEIRRVGDMNTVIYKVSEKTAYLEIDGMGKRRASSLEKQDVKTIEQLAELSDASINSLGAGMVDLRKKARDHLASAAGIEPVRTVG